MCTCLLTQYAWKTHPGDTVMSKRQTQPRAHWLQPAGDSARPGTDPGVCQETGGVNRGRSLCCKDSMRLKTCYPTVYDAGAIS